MSDLRIRLPILLAALVMTGTAAAAEFDCTKIVGAYDRTASRVQTIPTLFKLPPGVFAGQQITIDNVRGISGTFTCKKDGSLDVIELNMEDFARADRFTTFRYLQVGAALLSAVTGKDLSASVRKITDLSAQATKSLVQSKLRGDDIPQGRADMDIAKNMDMTYWIGVDGPTLMIDRSAANSSR